MMTDYVTSALFVYTDDTKHLIKQLQNNSSGTHITSVAFDALMQTPHRSSLRGLVTWWLQDPLMSSRRFCVWP